MEAVWVLLQVLVLMFQQKVLRNTQSVFNAKNILFLGDLRAIQFILGTKGQTHSPKVKWQ